jgi:ATP-dependent helicase/nuclease subunit B
MLTVYTGSPHPDLEKSLAEEIKDFCRQRKIGRMAIVTPSGEVRDHLRLKIGREWKLPTLGCYLLTAHKFAAHILQSSAEFIPPMAMPELLAQLVKKTVELGHYPEFQEVVNTQGGPKMLQRSLRDLREAAVDPEDTASARENILRLYSEFESERRRLGLWVPSDVTIQAAETLEAGSHHRNMTLFSKIIYYGFFDMTGVQVRLLKAAAEQNNVRFYFPIHNGPACEFGREFLENTLLPIASEVKNIAETKSSPRPPLEPLAEKMFVPDAKPLDGGSGLPLHVVSVSGTEAEIRTAAREILRIIERPEDAPAYHEIALVARSLEPYMPWIKKVFEEYSIPFRTGASWAGSVLPAVKAAFAMIRAFQNDFSCKAVMDLLCSPWFDINRFGAEEQWPPYWNALARERGVIRGKEDWRRLKRLAERVEQSGISDSERENYRVRVIPEAVRALCRCVESLMLAEENLPDKGSWEELASAFSSAFEKHIRKECTMPEEPNNNALEEIRRTLQSMGDFEVLNETVDRNRFFQCLRNRLSEINAPAGNPHTAGVAVMDAMDARCRSFKAVLILGLHEGSFPRTVHDDPFLNDRLRMRLSDKPGVTLRRRSDSHIEERMLFDLAITSASEEIVLIHQRSDDDGKPLVPSWFLEETRRITGKLLPGKHHTTPRRLRDHFREISATPSGEKQHQVQLLSSREILSGILFDEKNPADILDPSILCNDMLTYTLEAGRDLAGLKPALGPRDGITGHLPWFPGEEREKRGLSASMLHGYAQCPFRLFAEQVLKLEEWEYPEDVREVENLEKGMLLHNVLEMTFSALKEKGYFDGEEMDWQSIFERCANDAFSDFEKVSPTGYHLLWERTKRELKELLIEYLPEELRYLRTSNGTPCLLEQSGAAELPTRDSFPDAVKGLRVYGRLDRLDSLRVDNQTVAGVVDYKFKSGKQLNTEDKNLALGAIRARNLQPAIYLLIAKGLLPGCDHVRAELHFFGPRLQTRCQKSSLDDGFWQSSAADQTSETLQSIMDGISRGEWFVFPESRKCQYCNFSAICRKSHGATRYRLTSDPRTKPVFDLGKKKLKK